MSNSSTIDYGGYTGTDATVYLYYHYIPKRGPAVFALLAFFVLGILNLGVTLKTRAWFMTIVALTCFLEMAGFVFRVAVLTKPTIATVAITQALLIISPIFLALVDYEAVGKLMRLGQGTGRLRPGLIAKLFFGSDILCLFIQVVGAGSAAKQTVAAQNLAKKLLILGLVLQLIFFTMFTIMTIYVHKRKRYNLSGHASLRKVWICLYSTIIILYIRSFYRLIEFCAGADSKVATTEWVFYIFDFLMILCCVVLFTVYHYGFYLKKPLVISPVGAVSAGNGALQGNHHANYKGSARPAASVQVYA